MANAQVHRRSSSSGAAMEDAMESLDTILVAPDVANTPAPLVMIHSSTPRLMRWASASQIEGNAAKPELPSIRNAPSTYSFIFDTTAVDDEVTPPTYPRHRITRRLSLESAISQIKAGANMVGSVRSRQSMSMETGEEDVYIPDENRLSLLENHRDGRASIRHSVCEEEVEASTLTSGSQSYESLEVEPNPDMALAREEGPGVLNLSGAFTVITKVNSLILSARDKLLGRRWIPTDATETVIIPDDLIHDYEIVYPPQPTRERLLIVKLRDSKKIEHKSFDAYFHVVYAKNGLSVPPVHSIFRAEGLRETTDIWHKCYKSIILFDIISSEKMKRREAIEKLFRKIKSKPLHLAVHIAIACDRVDYFDDAVVEYLRKTGDPIEGQFEQFCIAEGCYPLQLAIQQDRLQIVDRMLQLKANVLVRDWFGNSVLHVASLNSLRILELLWSASPKVRSLIDDVNHDGHTPIIVAVRAGNPRITSTLLGFGAKLAVRGVPRSPLFEAMNVKNGASVIDVLINASPAVVDERDAFGNTALHVAAYKESLAALLNNRAKGKISIDIDSRNNFGETPLHCFIRRANNNALSMVMLIASHGCDINAADDHGNTSLHKAVVSRSLHPLCIRFLLCTGSDPDKVNNRGESPRHVAALLQNADAIKALVICGAQRCGKQQMGCVSDCANLDTPRTITELDLDELMSNDFTLADSSRDFIASDYDHVGLNLSEQATYSGRIGEEFAKSPKKMVNLLSMDGGGVRGLVIIQTLLELERRFGEPIFPYFDWVAGTSTGSLIAAALAKGATLRELQLSYIRFKDQVFDGYTPPFDTKLLETFIKDQIGEGPMTQLQYPRIMISAVNALRFPVKLEFMRNYSSGDGEATENVPFWVALRRSTSAPVFFNPCDEYIDGGIIANNPTLDLLSEVQNFNSIAKLNMHKGEVDARVEINCVLSLGTGQIPTSPMMPLLLEPARPLQSMVAMKNLSLIFVDQATASEGAPVTRSRAWCDAISAPFFRLSAHLSHAVQLCTTNDLEVALMMWDTIKYCRKNTEYIDHVCKMLKRDGRHNERGNPFVVDVGTEAYLSGNPPKQRGFIV